MPVLGIGEPVRPIGRKRPGPNMGDPRRKRVDVAVGAIRLGDLPGEPIDRNATCSDEKSIERDDELGVCRGRDLAIIRNLTDFPKPFDRASAVREVADIRIARRVFEDENVLGDRGPRQPGLDRNCGERSLQGSQ